MPYQKRRFECTTGAHNKFWEIIRIDKVDDDKYGWTVTYGRIGNSGTSRSKWFQHPNARNIAYSYLLQSKKDKDYREVALVTNPIKPKKSFKRSVIAPQLIKPKTKKIPRDIPLSRINNLELE